MSICVKNINFRADKQLIIETGDHCMLERSEWKFRHSSQFYSEQERLKMAQDYLAVNHFMKVADYCRWTGLVRDKAARELKRWTEQPETGIDYRGQGSHKIYMVRSNL